MELGGAQGGAGRNWVELRVELGGGCCSQLLVLSAAETIVLGSCSCVKRGGWMPPWSREGLEVGVPSLSLHGPMDSREESVEVARVSTMSHRKGDPGQTVSRLAWERLRYQRRECPGSGRSGFLYSDCCHGENGRRRDGWTTTVTRSYWPLKTVGSCSGASSPVEF